MKTPRRLSLPRTLPMPLWLQGAVEILLAAAAGLVVFGVLILIGWLSLGAPGGLPAAVAATGQLWLAAHGVPLQLHVPAVDRAAAVQGAASLLPLGLTLVLLLVARRAGARLARASWEGEFWKPVLGGLAAYALVGAALAALTGTGAVGAQLLPAALIPLWVPLVGMVWGGHRESGSWLRLLGVDPEALAARYSQYTRWAGAYALSVLRAARVALLGLVAGGALLAGVSILWHWQRIIAAYQGLHAGMAGDLSLFLLQLAVLPNLILYALAWSTGAGFALGEGTLFSPAAADGGALPALPVLAAVPTAPGPFAFAVLVLPVLAGAMAAWWFVRAGEDHLDDWFALRLGSRGLAAVLSAVAFAVVTGALTGLGALLLAVLAHGSLGAGPFTELGTRAGTMFCWTAVTVAVGALIGRVVTPWFERDPATRTQAEGREPMPRARRAPAPGALADAEVHGRWGRRRGRLRRAERTARRTPTGRQDAADRQDRTERDAEGRPGSSEPQERSARRAHQTPAAQDAPASAATSAGAGAPEPGVSEGEDAAREDGLGALERMRRSQPRAVASEAPDAPEAPPRPAPGPQEASREDVAREQAPGEATRTQDAGGAEASADGDELFVPQWSGRSGTAAPWTTPTPAAPAEEQAEEEPAEKGDEEPRVVVRRPRRRR